MRYTLSEGAYVLGKFDTGDTVTLTLYKLSDGSSVTLTAGTCAEISTTGVFKWRTTDITTQPTSYTEYLWVMTNGTTSQYGKIVLGGDNEDNIASLKKYELNRWRITNDQFIVYDDDAVTPLLTFDLKDENGNATSLNPMERVPA